MSSIVSFQTVVSALLVISVGLNLSYAHLYTRARDEISAARARVPVTRLPPLVVQDTAGKQVVLDWSSSKRRTVLYVMTAKCGYCELNIEGLRALSRGSSQYEFVLLSLDDDDLEHYMRLNKVTAKAYKLVSPSHRRAYGFGVTPYTLSIDQEGVVVGGWRGAFTAAISADIGRSLGVNVPHIDEEAVKRRRAS